VPHRQPAKLACAHCGTALTKRTNRGTDYLGCGSCGSAFLGEDTLLSLLRQAQPTLRIDEIMRHNDGSTKTSCPVCKEEMELGWLDFLQLDICKAHGVWCGPGELDRALSGEYGQEIAEGVKRRSQLGKRQKKP
jgi:Zn-finger nucleic acid-binding protein